MAADRAPQLIFLIYHPQQLRSGFSLGLSAVKVAHVLEHITI